MLRTCEPVLDAACKRDVARSHDLSRRTQPQSAVVARPRSAEHLALGAALRAARESKGWTTAELSEAAVPPMHSQYISACERGELNITFATVLRLCRALDMTLGSLVADYERRLPPAV